MHTDRFYNTYFIFNSDLSGDVIIKNKKGELEVRGDALKAFISSNSTRILSSFHEGKILSIGAIQHRYGGLVITRDLDKYYWGIDDESNHKGTEFEEIPKYLYDALIKFEEDTHNAGIKLNK